MSNARLLTLAREFIKHCGSGNSFNKCAASCRIVDAEKGRVRAEFEVDESQSNLWSTLHGGCTASLVDIFTTLAILTSAEGQHPGVSVDLNVSYLAPAAVGETVVIDAGVVRLGKSLAFTHASLWKKTDSSQKIAIASHTKAFPRQ